MSEQTELGLKGFTATEALAGFRRVKLTASSGTAVEYADATDAAIGVTITPAAITEQATVSLLCRGRTLKCTGSKAFGIGAALFGAADGKLTDETNAGGVVATALQASSGDGSVIEVLFDNGRAADFGACALDNYSDTLGGVPIIVKAELVATGAQTKAVVTAPRKCLIAHAKMIARDAQAANVTLKNDGTAFTSATAKSGTDDTVTKFDLIAEYDEVAAGKAITASFSAAGAVDVVLILLPIA